VRGPAKWTWFYLYVLLLVFSRYAPGWIVATKESAALAERLIAETIEQEGIVPGQLTIHADRGTSMRRKPGALLLADLGVERTHSPAARLHRQPLFRGAVQERSRTARPSRPASALEDARAFCRTFFPWYNTEHGHAGIGLMTPVVVHAGLVGEVTAERQHTLARAYEGAPRAFRPPPTPAPVRADRGVDQPAQPKEEPPQ
jgi:putative transposase